VRWPLETKEPTGRSSVGGIARDILGKRSKSAGRAMRASSFASRAFRKVVRQRAGYRGGLTGGRGEGRRRGGHGLVAAACRSEERNGTPLGVSVVQDPHFLGSSVAPSVFHVRGVVLGRRYEL
jgi:hypothetical protein